MGKKTETKKKEGKKGVEKKECSIDYRSFTDKNKWYKITITDNDIKCTCPDFVYRKQKLELFCKHICEILK